jgi:hypothetical protein
LNVVDVCLVRNLGTLSPATPGGGSVAQRLKLVFLIDIKSRGTCFVLKVFACIENTAVIKRPQRSSCCP